jgi:oligosaccharide repeat unit polymerase
MGDARVYILLTATIWWLILASLNAFELSLLQLVWSGDAVFAIYVYFPICFLSSILVIKFFPLKMLPGSIHGETQFYKLFVVIFYLIIVLFLVQAVLFIPPALSGDPSGERLNWGFKYVHVATEILIRSGVLVCTGCAVSRRFFRRGDYVLLALAVSYAVLVVSRGLILEVLIYFVFGSILIARRKNKRFTIRRKHVLWMASIWALFFVYGEWRQGGDFSISEYGEMLIESNAIAWFFGYFLVNYDNLALIIMEGFSNNSLTNVFGPFLQTLQIMHYEQIDDYTYVGRFNLGTALRPYVIDFGPWLGGVAFTILLSIILLLPNLCRLAAGRFSILISLGYMCLLFPVTSRIEQPAYIIPLIIIISADRFFTRGIKR